MPDGMEALVCSWILTLRKRAGGKGKSPFGQYMGEFARPGRFTNADRWLHRAWCVSAPRRSTRCGRHEVLSDAWDLHDCQRFDDGYRYRLRVNDGNHVGSGGGHIVYVNGKPLDRSRRPAMVAGRADCPRARTSPRNSSTTSDGWKDDHRREDFFAVQRRSTRSQPTDGGRHRERSACIWRQQKLPPMGNDLVLTSSATVVPMLSSAVAGTRRTPEDRERQKRAP